MRAQVTLDEIGVVAIGRNGGDRLITCLASVTAGVRDVVYVDSRSTDGNMATAVQFGALVVRMDLTQPFTAGWPRNEALPVTSDSSRIMLTFDQAAQ